ncbi:MAG TPA: PAS domain S-box protein [Burkholderiaceae bacterium]|nr:PAS domain S-box protein [Burkholderiaceae bacterium]
MHSAATSTIKHASRLSAALSLFEVLSDAVVISDHSGLIVDLNPAAEIFFGYSLSEVRGKPAATLVRMTGLDMLRAEARSVLERNGHWQGEATVQVKNGSRRIVDATVVNVAPAQVCDSPLRVIISRDITSQRHAEQSARESESRFRRMADTAPVLIWQSDTDALCDYFNRPWLTFTGRPLELELGNGWTDGVHPEDLRYCLQIHRRAFASRESFQVAYRLRRHDGQYRWLLDNGAPRYAPDGGFEGYVGSCIDITQHKELEEALRTRTEELLLAGRRKDEFLAMLSHELRNPLAPIANSIAVIRTFDIADPLLASSLTIIQRQADHLRELVNDLLDVARVANGKINASKEAITLESVIDRALEISHPKIAMYAHTLEVLKPSGPVYINGDLMRLAQALSNIVNNAAKFTPESGVIKLIAGQRYGQAFITVRDNGLGISRDFQPRLFELFAQADESLARTQSGLGIGLTIAHEIAILHGGTIESRSDGIGCGSEFTLYLPTTLNNAADKTADIKKELPVATALTENKDFRILLIDDNIDANESMGSLLKLLHYDVRTAKDAETGLDIAIAFKPHLILSDIGLPGMNGYQLAPALRKAAGARKMIIAAATGYGLASDRLRSQAAGFDHHLVKPIDADFLLNFVAQQFASY